MLIELGLQLRNLASALANFQARLLLSVFYLTLLVPFALVARLKKPRLQGWLSCSLGGGDDLAKARRQF